MQIIKILLVLGILTISQNIQAQIKFFNIYTNNGYDFGEGVCQLSDSSYLITGSSSSFGEGPAQAFILHVDSSGNRLWSNSYGGAESDWGRRIFAVEGDGIYVAGYTNSFGNGLFDFYFFKTDFQGNLLFEKTYGGSNFEKLHGAVMMPDTTFILVGETLSNDTEIEDMYLMRLKSNGDTIWTKTIGSAGKDVAKNVNIVNDSTFIVVGDYFVQDSLMQKAIVMKMNVNGNIDWTNYAGQSGNYSLNDVTINNNIIRAVGSNFVVNNGETTFSYVYKYLANLDGSLIIELLDQSGVDTRIDYLTAYGDSNRFYIAEQAINSTIPVFGVGEDCFIRRFNEYLFWENVPMLNTSNLGQDQTNQMIPTSDGGAIIVGYNTSFGAGGKNITLVKIGANDDYPASYTAPIENSLLSIETIENYDLISIFPNPIDQQVQISSTFLGKISIQIIDLSGKKIYENSFESNMNINFESYQSGVYFIQIGLNEKQRMMKVIKR
jgi:hypothetical protein